MRFPPSVCPGPVLRFPLTLLLGAALLGASSAQAQLWQTPQATARQPILRGFAVNGNVFKKKGTAYTLDVVAGRVVGVLVETSNTADLARGFGVAWGMNENDLTELESTLKRPALQSEARRGIVEPSGEEGTDIVALRTTGKGAEQRWTAYLALNILPETAFLKTANTVGQAAAPNTVHILSDFQCPACLDLWQGDLKAWRGQPQHYRVSYHHFPLEYHKNAFSAAEASECAAAQGKFWPYADALFRNFSAWARLNASGASDRYAAYARAVGLDSAAFNRCRGRGAAAAQVRQQQVAGGSVFLTGTPTVYLNGIKLMERSSQEQQRVLAVTRATPSAGTVIEGRLRAFR